MGSVIVTKQRSRCRWPRPAPSTGEKGREPVHSSHVSASRELSVDGDDGDLVNNREVGQIPCAMAEQFTCSGCYHLGDEGPLLKRVRGLKEVKEVRRFYQGHTT